jgi:uncharacterized protein (DUF58 family)
MEEPREEELAELLEEVRRIEVQSRRLVAEVIAGGYSSVFRGAGIEFDEVREYVPGDDPRAVDWNVTARTSRPHVTKYVDERELTLVFLLDTSPSMSGGLGHWSARQAAARIAGCLALSAVRQGDKVGLIAGGGRVERYVPPGKGSGHALRVIRDCLALPAAEGGSDLRPLLERASRVLGRHAILFLLSDFLAAGWEESLALCARRHDLIAVPILHPELENPPAAMVRLADPEGGGRRPVDLAHPPVRAAYLERVAAWRDRTGAALRRAGVDRMDLPVPPGPDPEAIARPLLQFFRMRQARGAKR